MIKAKPHKVLAAGDVADLLGVSYQYIDRLAQEGKLPFQQTSSGRIFLEEDVVAFKRKRDQKAKKDPRIKLHKRAKQG
ncbi:helix-turn-helix domain-containing protein [Candidatus Uhrbacteria bacterium]|nr:helix-turn-helix domain-containing protein [Candidatus Uhrbacteria bacterium]